MPQLPDVLRAMQSIQVDTEEVLGKLEKLRDLSTENGVLLGQCTDILNNIWRRANDYEAALPQIILRPYPPKGHLGSDRSRIHNDQLASSDGS